MATLFDKSTAGATRPLNRVRAIFIGHGEAGKTSLIRALHGEPVVKGNEPMTPGIAIREWPVPGSEIVAYFWDFGGQVMAHATHQLLLRESCLYVLVISARAEINATDQAQYWLEHVKAFGKGAPVLIVGNKLDQASLSLDIGFLKEKYPNIVQYFTLSCAYAKDAYQSHFNAFLAEFIKQLQAVGTHQMLFTDAQFAVLSSLRKRTPQSAFLRHEEFTDLCAEHGVKEDGPQNRDWLVDILDKLGVIIHFPQLRFADAYVLNPRWLTYGVYTLMYAQKSSLTSQDIIEILGGKKIVDENGNALSYPAQRCQFIRDAMQQFKLCYPLPNDPDTVIIPALLPAVVPTFTFDKTTALAFDFKFNSFLPRHILPELIVNRHTEIQQQVVWQHGVLLAHRQSKSQALVQADYHMRTLALWVAGPAARDYLAILRDEISAILCRLTIEYEELIVLPLAARIDSGQSPFLPEEKVNFRQVLAHANHGRQEFISASGFSYDISKVLSIFAPEARQVNNIYNISNSTIIHSNIHSPNGETDLKNILDIVIPEQIPPKLGMSEVEQRSVFNENITCHYTALEIASYKKLQNFKLKSVSRINLFAGVNNSGKTSLLEAIYLLTRQNDFAGIREVIRRRGKIAENHLESALFVDQFPGLINISGQFDQQNASVSLRDYHDEDSKLNKSQYLKSVEISAMFGAIQQQSVTHLFDGQQAETLAKSFKLLSPVVYSCPFFLNEPQRYANFYKKCLEAKSISTIIEFIRKEIVPTLNDIRLSDQFQRFMVDDSQFAKGLDLMNYGEGLQRIFFISLLFASAQNGIILIDEFENAIHVDLIGKFAPFIHQLALKFNVQVFLTSHSKECIDAFVENAPNLDDFSYFALVAKGDKIEAREFAGRKFHALLMAGNVDLRKAR